MDKVPPLPPAGRQERLLRGPLILTAISRVVMVPFYFICAAGSSMDLRKFYHHVSDYRAWYVVDLVSLAVTMWTFLFFNVLLAVLFFSRRRAFRPLMIYFSFLLPLLLVGIGVHGTYFVSRHRTHTQQDPYTLWIGWTLLLAVVVWPFYYGFSPRVKRVFTR